MKVLVIGASSFIGAYTVEALRARDIEVVATGRNERFADHYETMGIRYVRLDVENKEGFSSLDGEGFDGVVTLASRMPANVITDQAEDDLSDYVSTNVIGTLNILEYCRRDGIPRLVSIVSRFDTLLYEPDCVVREDSPLNFSYKDDHAAYVVANNMKAEALEYYNERYGMKNVWLRIPAIYGVGPHGSFRKNGSLIKSGLQIFIEKAMNGEPIEVFGDASTSKDVVYVKDLADLIVDVLFSQTASGLYNVGYDENFKLLDLARAVARVFARDENAESPVASRPDIDNNGSFSRLANERIKDELGFAPRFDDPLKMMQDYKAEMDRGVYSSLFEGNADSCSS